MWWIVLVIIALLVFMFIRAVYIKKKYCFKCEKCKCKCQPSIFNIVGNLNNYVGTIYLKCPNCNISLTYHISQNFDRFLL